MRKNLLVLPMLGALVLFSQSVIANCYDTASSGSYSIGGWGSVGGAHNIHFNGVSNGTWRFGYETAFNTCGQQGRAIQSSAMTRYPSQASEIQSHYSDVISQCQSFMTQSYLQYENRFCVD